jgi:mannose-6-phosphate isomerase
VSAVVLPLTGTLQNYAWGSHHAIATLQGREPSDQPEAELWFGAHPKAPSPISGSNRTLLGELERDALMAGPRGRLPFLMKILAIETPCSIQVHPSPQQAHEGYTRELGAGIELDAPDRCYVDAYDKPELLCALEPCDALVGFRAAPEIAAFLRESRCDALADHLATEQPGDVFINLLNSRPADVIANVTNYAQTQSEPVWIWVTRLQSLYPNDPGVLAPLFLQLIELQPGQALFVPAGLIHSYLGGLAVEVMGASDNVLRAGLTPKHIDVAELARVITPTADVVDVISARSSDDGWVHWDASCDYFHLAAADLDQSTVALTGPAIVVTVSGSVVVSSSDQRYQVVAGAGAFIAAGDKAEVTGSGRVFACTAP